MSPQEGDPSLGEAAQSILDRCPNCNGPLRFPADQAEAYCPSCRIFIEILKPLSPARKEKEPLDSDELRLRAARLYVDLDDVLQDEPPEATPESASGALRESLASEAEPGAEVAEEESEALAAPTELSAAEDLAVLVRPRGWHRVLFYAGSLLVAFGGSGLALGSVLHDVFRVPFFGSAYDAFGNLNVSALVFGAAFLSAGFAAMAVGARAGARPRHALGG